MMSSQKRSRANFESDGPPRHAPYALFGTPLPAFDPDVRDDGSYVPVWKQEVTDERGRKRLHGAFTGGWSAGYFNSVGSKEGWAPSTFVSSRTNRADTKQRHKAEDFMDDEDLAEQAESQKLETLGDFAGLGVASNDGTKGMFSDLFKTSGMTMGVKLLQRMGWREGQGIGPKVRRRAQGDNTGDHHLFAPEDSGMISFIRKNDRKGLGFAGETSLVQKQPQGDAEDDSDVDARILSIRKSKVNTKPKKASKSSFGVGVLNDTGSDDEDPYTMGPQIKYNRIIGGDKLKKQKKKGGLIASTPVPKNSFVSQKLGQRSSNTLTGFRKCHDGRLPLQGFILSTKPTLNMQENQWPPPEVPPDWRPAMLANSASVASAGYSSTADVARASTLDARDRAAILGEQRLPGKSVFDYVTSAARDKLVAATGRDNLPQARGEGRPEGHVESDRRTLWDVVPRLDKETALAALQRGSRGWMPYAEDEDKRARYRAFISLQAGLNAVLPERPKGFSIDEWTKEMREFAQAAEVFKPISGLMASRFTTSSASPQLASDQPDAATAPTNKPKDPAEEAASVGMFGPLTRSRMSIHPTRLLCKRFNIKPPANVEVGPEDVAEARNDLVDKATIDRMMMHANFQQPQSRDAEHTGQEPKQSAYGQGPAEIDAGTNNALERRRADDHTLKSIFEDE
ncbi:hypothetical protein AMS68_007606 [Peltaster fructicola]|uniref:G-patch domain-containing protein n=1 Tax=Peltaster fructicola TaxID=286661 RepID=A0A6H0Y5I3_9PEZI|nr:hypothetical protein AMS68_007606 [Peltaster fructicola]